MSVEALTIDEFNRGGMGYSILIKSEPDSGRLGTLVLVTRVGAVIAEEECYLCDIPYYTEVPKSLMGSVSPSAKYLF